MTKEERTVATLEEVLDQLGTVKDALSDDGFEEYADSLQDGIDRINTLLFILTHKDPLEAV